jgi:methylglyoxal synthase
VTRLKSGPLGGDQQIGALIATGEVSMLIFFTDPLTPLPHDVDVKALLRIAVVHNSPIACNRATADFLLTSPLLGVDYQPALSPGDLAPPEREINDVGLAVR